MGESENEVIITTKFCSLKMFQVVFNAKCVRLANYLNVKLQEDRYFFYVKSFVVKASWTKFIQISTIFHY